MPSIRDRRKKARRRTFDIAKEALNTALKVKSLINVEFKHVDVTATTVTPANTGNIQALSSIAEGDGSNQREGLSIRAKSLYLNYSVQEHASATATQCRVMLIKDKNPRGSTPTWSEIMEENNVLSLMNNLYTKRYTVLYRKDHFLSSTGELIEGGSAYIKLNDIVKYNSSGGAATDIEANGYYLVTCSNQATNVPSVNFVTRLRYIDN